MNVLRRTTRANIYLLAAPAFAAALTRSGGMATANLYQRLHAAFFKAGMRVNDVKFARSPVSGDWYVHAIPSDLELDGYHGDLP